MFAIEIPFFDIEKSAAANPQAIWRKMTPEKFLFIDGGEAVIITKQRGDKFVFSCSFDDFCKKWYYYFDIGVDYCQLQTETAAQAECEIMPCLLSKADVMETYAGVRMFNFEYFDCLLTSAVYACGYNKPSIMALFDAIKKQYSKERLLLLYKLPALHYRAFPTPAEFVVNGTRRGLVKLLRNCGVVNASIFCKIVRSAFLGSLEPEKMPGYLGGREFLEAFGFWPSESAANHWHCRYINYMLATHCARGQQSRRRPSAYWHFLQRVKSGENLNGNW